MFKQTEIRVTLYANTVNCVWSLTSYTELGWQACLKAYVTFGSVGMIACRALK